MRTSDGDDLTITGSGDRGGNTLLEPRPTVQVSPKLPGNLELTRSGGSMVAKLKLKGIDGRAPQGVENAA
jgi:hypothetical protein